MLTNEEEHNVVSGCQKNNRKAQELLYKSYYQAMMTLCLRYTKNDDDAVEVLNHGFFKVFKNIHLYRKEEAGLYTWIRTIIINCCIDFIKQKQAREPLQELNGTYEISIEPEVLNKILTADLLKVIRTLPAATRGVFNLYVMEGYNHREIAGMMNISEGTSKWHLSEARKILQQKLQVQETFLNE